MDVSNPVCLACQVDRGVLVPPGGPLYDDGLWRLDHAIEPSPLAGWLILKPLRHVEALGELTDLEAAALGPLLRRVARAMDETLSPANVYVGLFGESWAHPHFHLIPRAPDLPPGYRGPDVFALLNEAARAGTNRADVAEALRVALATKGRLAAPAG